MATRKRSKKIAVAAAAAALAAAAACAALLAWQPWAAAEQAAQEQEAAEQAAQDASGQDDGSGASDGGSGQADDGSGASDGEEWPGQSLGYVGPNGEGSLSDYEYSTNEEYAALLDELGSGVENDIPSEVAEGEGGVPYEVGVLAIYFTCSEYDAHAIVEERGGVWGSDLYLFMDEPGDAVQVVVYFPGCQDEASLEALAQEFESLDGVSGAVLQRPGGRTSDSSDVGLSTASLQQPYLDVSRFYSAWEAATCDHGATIAVLDSGFDLDHEDLAGNLLPAWDASEQGSLTEDLADGEGHGTMVAGVASAVSGTAVGIDGASHDAWVLPVRVMDDGGYMYWRYAVAALEMLDSMYDKPEAVNMSFEFLDISAEERQAVEGLIDDLREEDKVVFAAAAGNWRQSEGEESPTLVKYPAALEGVVSVASVDASKALAWDSQRNACVDVCAVGVGVYSTANLHSAATLGLPYATMSGTSFAAPQVAAAAALLRVQNPGWSADQVEARLLSTAEDLGASGRDDEHGAGLLDAAEAVGYSSGSGGSAGYRTSRAEVQAKIDEGYAYYLEMTR